jgi:hypothetical protein
MRWKIETHILIFWISKELHQKDQYSVKGEHYTVRYIKSHSVQKTCDYGLLLFFSGI